MKVDHLIVGAGLAGLLLKRSLNPSLKVAIVDPSPASWKIGEANAPELFDNPILEPMLDQVKRLPSYSPKNGSLFIGADSAAIYPIVSNSHAALHVARDELENLLIRAWNVDVRVESVTAIDLASKVVKTDRTTYEVSRQIIDCSGGAMVVARLLEEVESLWLIHSSWRYYDVTGQISGRFWDHLRDTRRSWLGIDIPQLRLLPIGPEWSPSGATCLTQVRDGVWLWQIALFGGSVLSVGAVSRHGPVSESELDGLVEEHHLRHYVLRKRTGDGSSPYDRFHQRTGFALRARRAATADYILVGDAFMFVDPVYSVGTTIAVNKALEVAAFLNRNAWTPENVASFCRRYEALLQERSEAFLSWYSEENMLKDENTARVRGYFPEMSPFQAGISWQYSNVVAATLRQSDAVRRCYGAAPRFHRETARVS